MTTCSVVTGSSGIDFARAFDSSISPNEDALILFEARLPRVVLGAIAGAGLGAAGAALQALLRNPLADPYVLGEATNTAQTYGYDVVTQMQETKTTLCQIAAA